MRSFRDIQAIVRDYPPAPDEESLRQLCERHLEHVNNVMDITDWIKHDTPNPYLRELYATQTAQLLKEHCEEDNWQSAACEEAIDALALIARQALGSQIGDNFYNVEKIAYTQPQQEAVAQSVPYFRKIEEQMDYFRNELSMVKAEVFKKAKAIDYFPYFTKKAIEENRTEEVMEALRGATNGTAQDLVNELNFQEAMGYISVKQLNARVLFDKLCQFLPVPFSYRNFTKYRH